MNIENEIYAGKLAWLPSPNAKNLDVWVDDHVPMVGTFTIDGATIVFSAVMEPKETVSVWIYAELTPDEVAYLDDHLFSGVLEMNDYLDEIFASRQVTFASTGDYKIRQYSDEFLDGQSTLQGTIDFLRKVRQALTLEVPRESNGTPLIVTPELSQVSEEADHFARLVSA